MDLFYLIGIAKRPFSRLVSFGLGSFDHLRIHFLELMGLAGNGFLKVLFGPSDPIECPQMVVGMDDFVNRFSHWVSEIDVE